MRRPAAPVILATLLAVALACNSDGDSPTAPPAAAQTPTQTVAATPAPSTVPASPTPSYTATAAPTRPATPTAAAPSTGDRLPVESLSHLACNAGGNSPSGSLGTAPGPTPVPTADPTSSDPAVNRQRLADYLSETSSLVDYLVDWNRMFETSWSANRSSEERAALLQVLSTRMSIACSAVSLLPGAPSVAGDFGGQAREAVVRRHEWAGAAIAELKGDGGTGAPVGQGSADSAGLIFALDAEFDRLAEQAGPLMLEERPFTDSALGVELVVPAGWVVAADGLSPLLQAPAAQNAAGLQGLGPSRWGAGTAVKIRRLRNPDSIDAGAASERFRSLVTRQGPVISIEESTLAGHPALRHILDAGDPDWIAVMTVLVAGDFTYFVEFGCHAGVDAACDAADKVVGSLSLTP